MWYHKQISRPKVEPLCTVLTYKHKRQQARWMSCLLLILYDRAPYRTTGVVQLDQPTTLSWRVCARACVFTSIYGSECRTQRSKTRGANVVVMVTMGVRSILLVICSPMGKGRRYFRGKEWRWGRQRDVWRALCSFFLFDSILVTPTLSNVLFLGFNQFGQRFSSRPLAPPGSTQQH